MRRNHFLLWSTCVVATIINQLNLWKLVEVLDSHDEFPVGLTNSQQQTAFLDILSIGSQHRLHYLTTQRRLLGAHPSVRHFFNVTELNDDTYPAGTTTLTAADVDNIIHVCRSRNFTSQLVSRWKRYFASPSILRQKDNPLGWLCAQTRPVMGLHYVLKYYRDTATPLPKYLILQDDDTFWNLDRLSVILNEKTSHCPLVLAGCLIRLPGLWIPHGGFGLVLNQAVLQELTTPATFLTTNDLEEQSLLKPTMTLIDLMYAYVKAQPFADYKNWTSGFCVHSDWIWGYFLQYYSVATMTALEENPSSSTRNRRGTCDASSCPLVCHSVTPDAMNALVNDDNYHVNAAKTHHSAKDNKSS